MESVYTALTALPNTYAIQNGKSTIRITFNVIQYVIPNLDGIMMDIEQCLKKHNIKYEKKVIRFFSEYPSFLIYEKDENIGIVAFNLSISI
jgi:hypothetical protein